MINSEMKMAEMIFDNHDLLIVLERFKINLGFGNKTIKEVCATHNINLSLFLMVVNSFSDHDYMPDENEWEWSPSELIQYLKNSHVSFLDDKLPLIQRMIDRFIEQCDEPKAVLLKQFFSDYYNEVKEHMDYEESVVFPYIERLSEKKTSDNATSYTILTYSDKHDDIEEKVNDLKSILLKYLPGSSAQQQRIKILSEVFHFEEDLNSHGLIEDKLLIPMVEKMEKQLFK